MPTTLIPSFPPSAQMQREVASPYINLNRPGSDERSGSFQQPKRFITNSGNSRSSSIRRLENYTRRV